VDLVGLLRFFISTGVKVVTSGDSWQGAFKLATMLSSLLLSEFGVKTIARCLANRIAFSLVEQAQFLSCFLRGGMATINLLIFFFFRPFEFHAEILNDVAITVSVYL
jgi:hypothetical protein